MGNIFDLFRAIEKKKTEPAGAPEWLIVGLGNPGRDYAMTRHNAGFLALDYLTSDPEVDCRRVLFRSLTGRGVLEGHSILFMKPQTFMNLSGEAVRDAAAYYGIPPERILVLVDDVNLAPGRIRIRRSGSAGGHNGLESIIYLLDSDAFPRIRIGVGEKPRPDYELKDWVLGKIPEADFTRIRESLADAAGAARLIVSGRIDEAMGAYNGRVHA